MSGARTVRGSEEDESPSPFPANVGFLDLCRYADCQAPGGNFPRHDAMAADDAAGADAGAFVDEGALCNPDPVANDDILGRIDAFRGFPVEDLVNIGGSDPDIGEQAIRADTYRLAAQGLQPGDLVEAGSRTDFDRAAVVHDETAFRVGSFAEDQRIAGAAEADTDLFKAHALLKNDSVPGASPDR